MLLNTEEMNWHIGGPFLEISFLMKFETNRQRFIKTFMTKLK